MTAGHGRPLKIGVFLPHFDYMMAGATPLSAPKIWASTPSGLPTISSST